MATAFTLFVVGECQRSKSTKHTSDLGRPDGHTRRMDGATRMAETIMAAAVENLLVTDGKEGREGEERGDHTYNSGDRNASRELRIAATVVGDDDHVR